MWLFQSFKRLELLNGTARKLDDVQRIEVESQELVWRIVGRCWLYQRRVLAERSCTSSWLHSKKCQRHFEKTATYWLCERSQNSLSKKKKTTSQENKIIARKSRADQFKTAAEIKAEMQVEHGVCISSFTTRRRLREAGLKGCRSRQKPRLTKRHKKARLEFATLHKNWTATLWSRVILSDESKISYS